MSAARFFDRVRVRESSVKDLAKNIIYLMLDKVNKTKTSKLIEIQINALAEAVDAIIDYAGEFQNLLDEETKTWIREAAADKGIACAKNLPTSVVQDNVWDCHKKPSTVTLVKGIQYDVIMREVLGDMGGRDFHVEAKNARLPDAYSNAEFLKQMLFEVFIEDPRDKERKREFFMAWKKEQAHLAVLPKELCERIFELYDLLPKAQYQTQDKFRFKK